MFDHRNYLKATVKGDVLVDQCSNVALKMEILKSNAIP